MNFFYKQFEVKVKTGSAKGAGTNSNVKITLIDEDNRRHEETLNKYFYNDFTYGHEDTYTLNAPKHFGKVHSIELHKDNFGLSPDWFIEHVSVEHDDDGVVHFPLVRWIPSNSPMRFLQYDSILPQDCKALSPELYNQRTHELDLKKASFAFGHLEGIQGMPRNVLKLPPEEVFSKNYLSEVATNAITSKIEAFVKNARYDDKFSSFEDMFKMYFGINNPFKVPKGAMAWRTDEKFAFLRVGGPNPTVIRGCKKINGLPAGFAVDKDAKDLVAKQFFEGKSFDQALSEDRLFFIDYQDLEEYTAKDSGFPMVCPFALFYSRIDGVLIPIAIQLYQKPSATNPVFYPPPIHDERVWLHAKLWFGVADSNYHEPVSHLLQTHLVAGDFITCFHNTVSASHPVYKLMLPHFIYLLNINTFGLPILIGKDGAFNTILALGKENCDSLMVKKYKEWNLAEKGWLHTEVANRGVENLPNYYFYEDSKPIFDAIHTYIKASVEKIYGKSAAKLHKDNEIQNFRALLTDETNGMKGVWGNGKNGKDGQFVELEDLSKTLTSIVFILTNVHAAVNFNQYDEYGYPPNMPFRLNGAPPTNTHHITEEQLYHLFNSKTMLGTLELLRTLSLQGTNKIGNYEVQYQYKPFCLEEYNAFRVTLGKIKTENERKNRKRKFPYPWLSPAVIPNSISI